MKKFLLIPLSLTFFSFLYSYIISSFFYQFDKTGFIKIVVFQVYFTALINPIIHLIFLFFIIKLSFYYFDLSYSSKSFEIASKCLIIPLFCIFICFVILSTNKEKLYTANNINEIIDVDLFNHITIRSLNKFYTLSWYLITPFLYVILRKSYPIEKVKCLTIALLPSFIFFITYKISN